MAVATSTALLVAAATAAAATAYTGQQAAKAQSRASDKAAQLAARQASQAEQETNRANAKKPNVASLLASNERAARGGIGSTMLTGPSGADLTPALLGRNTLLGG